MSHKISELITKTLKNCHQHHGGDCHCECDLTNAAMLEKITLHADNEALRNRVAVLEENEFWSETEALRAERDELLKDKERLDWVGNELPLIERRLVGGLLWKIFTEDGGYEGKTLRAAIDAAMNERKAEKE